MAAVHASPVCGLGPTGADARMHAVWRLADLSCEQVQVTVQRGADLFSEAVAGQCLGCNARVLAACRGHTPTELQAISGVDRRPTRTSAQASDDVVRETLAALDRGRSHVVVTGAPNRSTTQIPRLPPREAMVWIVERPFRPHAP